MINEKLKSIIANRISMNPEYDFGIEQCWNEALKLVKVYPEEVLKFVQSSASDTEVYWFSEILCDIYDLTEDERFIKAFGDRAANITDAEMKRSIIQEIGHV